MDRNEIMQLAAEKAIHEMSWESIKFLFRPGTMLELFLRLDFNNTQKKIYEWAGDDSPDAIPHRFRSEPFSMMLRAIEVEKFYQRLKILHGSRTIAQLLQQKLTTVLCKWKYDDTHDKYDTTCDQAFQFINGNTVENNFLFCPFCGGKIEA